MPKHYPVNEPSTVPESAETGEATSSTTNETEPGAAPSFWILKDATAKKLGKRSEGSISYQILADADRQHLYVAITGNENGGYFSRERVPFQSIEECLSSLPKKSFPSKALLNVFYGRSSNNPGFMAAVLSAEGLIAADATAETLHKVVGDWSAWQQKMLALPGTLLQAEPPPAFPDAGDEMPEHTETAEPEEAAPAKARKGNKQTKEASHAGDTPSE